MNKLLIFLSSKLVRIFGSESSLFLAGSSMLTSLAGRSGPRDYMLTWSSSGLETGEPISGDFSDCNYIYAVLYCCSSAWASSYVVVLSL